MAKPQLAYYQVEYTFVHKSGHTSKYAVVVPGASFEDAKVKALDKMRREGTPMDRVTVLGVTPDILR